MKARARVYTGAPCFAAALFVAVLSAGPFVPHPATAASAKAIDRDVDAALLKLYRKNSSARMLRDKAKGILVFPHMLKAGFLFGGQIGEGALRRGGRTTGFYNSVAASYGLQAGAQVFGYALFFMSDESLVYLDKSGGFEVGVGPSVVIVDEGVGKSITSINGSTSSFVPSSFATSAAFAHTSSHSARSSSTSLPP